MSRRNPISQFRSILYTLARLLGDLNAIIQGPQAMMKRAARRTAGRITARGLGRLFR